MSSEKEDSRLQNLDTKSRECAHGVIRIRHGCRLFLTKSIIVEWLERFGEQEGIKILAISTIEMSRAGSIEIGSGWKGIKKPIWSGSHGKRHSPRPPSSSRRCITFCFDRSVAF